MERLAEIQGNHWKAMIQRGFTTFSYWNTRESAEELLQPIIDARIEQYYRSELAIRGRTPLEANLQLQNNGQTTFHGKTRALLTATITSQMTDPMERICCRGIHPMNSKKLS